MPAIQPAGSQRYGWLEASDSGGAYKYHTRRQPSMMLVGDDANIVY